MTVWTFGTSLLLLSSFGVALAMGFASLTEQFHSDLDIITRLLQFAIVAGIMAISIIGIRRQMQQRWRLAHRKCLNCGYDIHVSGNRCPECGTPIARVRRHKKHVPLRDDWPDTPITPRIPALDEDYVVLHTTSDPIQANLLCQQLNARGVSCKMENHHADRGHLHYTPAPVVQSLIVLSGDRDIAKDIAQRLGVSTSAVS